KVDRCLLFDFWQPWKGIRTAPPPRTSKTMLAQAVATEAGAKFVNISVGSIAFK
ncbi:UNVERIFIED_CONTAM: hypothetical protein Sindi_2531600, partial [Sesamum indicum]